MKLRSMFSALFLLMAATVSSGQTPVTISYQGFLADTDDKALPNGGYALTVRLYDSAHSNTPLWTETQFVAINNGIFSVVLGSTQPLHIPLDRPYWVSHAVGTNAESVPRIKFAASASSLNDVRDGFALINSTPFYNGNAVAKKTTLSQKAIENREYAINGCLIINCSRQPVDGPAMLHTLRQN